ncbi:hypothetical protein [Streptomyces sp. NPDC057580]|uniref:hypothetical protein n=1 Tax=Streptomyces sp. NPDC057580 TaxID=3346173 RepID=UPI00369DA7EB
MGEEGRFAPEGVALQADAHPMELTASEQQPGEPAALATAPVPAVPEAPVQQQAPEPSAPAVSADAPGFRETSVGVWPRRAVVRTEQTGSIARLEREHTKAVRETLLALHVQNADAHETDEIAAVHSREWPDKEGLPSSGERTRTEVLQNIAEHAARARKRTLKAPRTNWDDARKGWPALRFNLDVTDPRVSEYHEYVPETVATSAAPEPPPPTEPDTATPNAAPVPESVAAAARQAQPGLFTPKPAVRVPSAAVPPATSQTLGPDTAPASSPLPVVLTPGAQLGLFAQDEDAAPMSTPTEEAELATVDAIRPARTPPHAEEITQQRDDIPEIAEPPLPANVPEPLLPPATPDRMEEAPMATPTVDPIQAAAEASRVSQPPVPARQAAPPAPLEERAWANAEAAMPETQRKLPLWTGNDLPDGAGWTARDGVLYDGYGAPTWKLKTPARVPNPTQVPAVPPAPAAASPEVGRTDPGNAYDPADLWAADLIEPVGLPEAFERVEEAWADIVPPDLGTAQDLRAAVDNDLRTLEQQWRRMVPGPQVATDSVGPQPAAAASASAADAQQAAVAVNTALQEADRHAPALKDWPEWQQLQTVRGAAAHLWDVIKEKAGPYFERLADDVRVQGFWRTVSARSCETIARWAQAGADRLRSGVKRPDLLAAEALLKVSDAALAYSSPRSERPDAVTVADEDSNLAEIRLLRSTLRSNAPLLYATRDDAVEASREIARAFQAWAGTDMGKELGASTHRRVAEFREAWQQLPPSQLPGGPGPAAGPYSAVAEHAQGIVERAQAQPGRFAPSDLAALQTVADLAEHHGGRLAATLPSGLTGPATPAAVVQQSAPCPAVATPGPAARPGAPRPSA